jgi:hypothetical protein
MLSDDGLRSFMFTLKNPHDVAPRTFSLNPEFKENAIRCCAGLLPAFGHGSWPGCNFPPRISVPIEPEYINDTEIQGDVLLTGGRWTIVHEIEVFEVSK